MYLERALFATSKSGLFRPIKTNVFGTGFNLAALMKICPGNIRVADYNTRGGSFWLYIHQPKIKHFSVNIFMCYVILYIWNIIGIWYVWFFLCLSRHVYVNEIWGPINIYTNDDPVFCRIIMSLIKEELIYNFTYYTPYTPLKILICIENLQNLYRGSYNINGPFKKFITVVFVTYLQKS